MATNDIMKALQNEVNIDDHTESRICTAVLKQLDDKANDVQSIAVKCLGVLVKTVAEAQISQISIKLCELVLSGPEELRDVYSIGLKTLISRVPSGMGNLLASTLTARLLAGGQSDNSDVKRECLDSLTDLLKRFGHLMRADHETILAQTLPHLADPKPAIQKRAVVCLSALSTTLDDAHLYSLIDHLLNKISDVTSSGKELSATEDRNLRIFIQAAGRVTRSVGHRLGGQVDRVVPVLLSNLGDFDNEDLQTDAGNELRENCFPGLESFILRCPREVAGFVAQILEKSLVFMKFDPNYSYGDDDEEGEGQSDDDDYDDDDYDDAGSDDDDTSWKVRKAALRVISALIRERDELLQDEDLYFEVCEQLLGRFKEREESVQLEVLICMTQLLEETESAMSTDKGTDATEMDGPPPLTRSISSGGAINNVSHVHLTNITTVRIDQSAIKGFLQEKLPYILRTANKLLRGNGAKATSPKIKSAVFVLLRRLVSVLHGSVNTNDMGVLMTILLECLHAERNQSLKLECLYLVMDIFKAHSSSFLHKYITPLLPEVFVAAGDDWYKIAATSLKLIGIIISTSRTLKDENSMEVDDSSDFDLSPFYQSIYDAVFPRLEALDVDHEIKESSIACTGQILGVVGDLFPPDLALNLVHILLKRIDNEMTRIAALKAISFIASSPIEPGVEITTVMSAGAVSAAIPFLRQQSRLLKQTTLKAISSIMSVQRRLQSRNTSASLLSPDCICELLKELSQLLLVSDMNIIDLGLRVIGRIIQSCQQQVEGETSIQVTLKEDVLPKAVDLPVSPMMQGGAQNSLIALLCLFYEIPQLGISVTDVKRNLMSHILRGQHADDGVKNGEYVPLAMQSVSNLAKCMAGVCNNSSPEIRRDTLVELLDEVDAPTAPSFNAESRRHLALLCIGRLGEHLSVTGEADAELAERLRKGINTCFEKGSEDVRSAAAFALGRLAVGSMSIFLPIVLEACTGGGNGDNKHQYLLLVALKETIVVHVTSSSTSSLSFSPYLETVLPGLLTLARTSSEEGVRNMVAECFGALASTPIYVAQITSLLQEAAHDEHDNKLLVWTVVTSMRFYFSRVKVGTSDYEVDPQPFLAFLQDSDLDVRRATLLMVNAAVHYTPSLVLPHMETLILPHLLVLLSLKQKREVQMGPFKHVVDDALTLRKGALTCIETMLYVMPEAINPSDLLVELTKLVQDNLNETNLQCHQILCKLCTVAPSAMLCAVDDFTAPLEKIVSRYEKAETAEGSAGPEKERAHEQVRSCIRLISSVNKMDNLDVCPLWQAFVARLSQKPAVSKLLAEHEGQKFNE